MDSPQYKPRRRNLYDTRSSATIHQRTYTSDVSATTNLGHSLQKSDTFHSPSSPCGENDPVLNIPSLPRRSFTSSRDLEALTTADDRIAQIIGAVDRSLSGLEAFSPGSQEAPVAEAPPEPWFMLHTNVVDPHYMQANGVERSSRSPLVYRCGRTRKHHTSDSGIGSTVDSSELSMSGDHTEMKQVYIRNAQAGTSKFGSAYTRPTALKEGCVQTGINGLTPSAAGAASGLQHALSEYACRQIQKHIILPILREEKLKDFHPLVTGIPYRVARKEITCLRDLEKVLLWLAPKWSATKSLFLNFCETSIQCIHTTVEHLTEYDQRRPSDRPYTNGYFLDLVEQVRQYATMLAASRARMVSGNDQTTLEDTSNERLDLVGGLSKTGRVAELVRTKGGRSISLRTGEEISADQMITAKPHGMKRSVSEQADEDVLRSMARRRKSAQPVVKDIQKCNDCDKVFKRPCDLTKHEKTHSRPWKCSDVTCKYHSSGWPTEKERDRHVNDKHSAAPSMYRCQYSPCPYESKRESNCKQHMEKAHGWEYVRSKNNGKIGKRPVGGRAPPTPQMSTPGSCIFDASSPESHGTRTFYEAPLSHAVTESLTGSVVAPESDGSYTNDIAFDDNLDTFDPTLTWGGQNNDFATGDVTEYPGNSHRPFWDSTIPDHVAFPSSFEGSMTTHDEEPMFGNSFDWSNMDHDANALNIQLATPATSVHSHPFDAISRKPSASHEAPLCSHIPSLSPGAQADAMLYSPYSMQSHDFSVDEGFIDYSQAMIKPTQDFALFDNPTAASNLNNISNEGMFEDLSSFNGPESTWPPQLVMGDPIRMEE